MIVVNKHHHAPTLGDVYIGRPSVLGNPYTHINTKGTLAEFVVHSREEAIEKYREWLWQKIRERDSKILFELKRLADDAILVCWCKPLSCHGEVIIAAIEWLKTQDWFISLNTKEETPMKQYDVDMYTDGAVKGRTVKGEQHAGPGGYCAILVCNGKEKEISGRASSTKVNLMELTAVYEGLKALKKPCTVLVHTDSANVIGWLYGFNQQTQQPDNGHLYQANNPAVRTLVNTILDLVLHNGHCIAFEKLQGHTGHSYNERCDMVASAQARNAERDLLDII